LADESLRTVTFKADRSLLGALRSLPNRSRFIRDAVQAALDGVCPMCSGTGFLSAAQRIHWRDFSQTHPIEECSKCHQAKLSCLYNSAGGRSPGRTAKRAGRSKAC